MTALANSMKPLRCVYTPIFLLANAKRKVKIRIYTCLSYHHNVTIGSSDNFKIFDFTDLYFRFPSFRDSFTSSMKVELSSTFTWRKNRGAFKILEFLSVSWLLIVILVSNNKFWLEYSVRIFTSSYEKEEMMRKVTRWWQKYKSETKEGMSKL